MSFEKLKIIAFKDEGFDTETGSEVEVMINPASYKLTSGIKYTADKSQGNTNTSPKFTSMAQDSLDFETIYDGTGAIQGGSSPPPSVRSQILILKKTIYTYTGDIHQPNFLKVVWGGTVFRCRLEGMTINYKLFAPSGQPLRAKVSLRFVGYISAKEEEEKKKQSSPDLTHLVEVKAGDTLPLLCFRIYKDSSYYQKVAKINGITSFRRLQPGTSLEFPPIRK
jgi:hypothetical protein